MNSTIDSQEVKKFSSLSNDWWDESGKFKPLHLMNPIRISYIKAKVSDQFNITDTKLPLKKLKILDIGCGGGLLAEPISKLGAQVTGLDASKENIKAAEEHAKKSNLNITYLATTVEEYANKKNIRKFDVILCMEIIEHVQNIELFIAKSLSLLKPDGLIFFSTINRTIKSYLLAIVGAEFLLRLLPIGTHEWKKFVKPSEIHQVLIKNKSKIIDIKGMRYNPLLNHSWSLSSNDLDVNYILCATTKL